VLSRALVGSVLLETVASPLAREPISMPTPARVSAHPLVSAGNAGEKFAHRRPISVDSVGAGPRTQSAGREMNFG
jgi:hypothetical protein